MHPLFTKIDLDLSDLDIDSFPATFFGHYGENFDVYHYDKATQDMLIARLPEKARSHVTVVGYVELTAAGILPHRDTRDTLINYYVRPCGSTTRFYRLTSKAKMKELQEGGDPNARTSTRIFSFEDGKEVESFTATKNDCYILNTKEVHGVDVTETSIKRKMLQYWFAPRTSYEQVVSYFS
jgi:hypothetical protein